MQARKYTQNHIRELLLVNDEAVERAILAIFRNQTDDEKSARVTKYQNGRGFTAAHAKLGSYYARWLAAGNKFSGTHKAKARKMALRYVRQLCEISNGEVI